MDSNDMTNSDLLRRFLQDGTIALEGDAFLWSTPQPLPVSFDFERVEGMLLGLAAGDSLGNTSEGLVPAQRKGLYGEITDYLSNEYASFRKVGLPSDDTQMAFWTVEVLLQDGCLDPEHLAQRFSRERIFGIGRTVMEFLSKYKEQRLSWDKTGISSAGNGALMRIAPVVLPHLRTPGKDLWADAALAGMVTHNDRASNAACVAFTAIFWDLLCMERPPAEDWWIDQYCRIAGSLEGSDTRYSSRCHPIEYSGPVWKFSQEYIQKARDDNWSVLQAANTWGSGAYLLETIPSVLYILTKYGRDPEQAILRAVNDTRDNDTVAAVVGAAVGALHGKSALPQRWIAGLLGRTNDNNDGWIFHLLRQAKEKFWD